MAISNITNIKPAQTSYKSSVQANHSKKYVSKNALFAILGASLLSSCARERTVESFWGNNSANIQVTRLDKPYLKDVRNTLKKSDTKPENIGTSMLNPLMPNFVNYHYDALKKNSLGTINHLDKEKLNDFMKYITVDSTLVDLFTKEFLSYYISIEDLPHLTKEESSDLKNRIIKSIEYELKSLKEKTKQSIFHRIKANTTEVLMPNTLENLFSDAFIDASNKVNNAADWDNKQMFQIRNHAGKILTTQDEIMGFMDNFLKGYLNSFDNIDNTDAANYNTFKLYTENPPPSIPVSAGTSQQAPIIPSNKPIQPPLPTIKTEPVSAKTDKTNKSELLPPNDISDLINIQQLENRQAQDVLNYMQTKGLPWLAFYTQNILAKGYTPTKSQIKLIIRSMVQRLITLQNRGKELNDDNVMTNWTGTSNNNNVQQFFRDKTYDVSQLKDIFAEALKEYYVKDEESVADFTTDILQKNTVYNSIHMDTVPADMLNNSNREEVEKLIEKYIANLSAVKTFKEKYNITDPNFASKYYIPPGTNQLILIMSGTTPKKTKSSSVQQIIDKTPLGKIKTINKLTPDQIYQAQINYWNRILHAMAFTEGKYSPTALGDYASVSDLAQYKQTINLTSTKNYEKYVSNNKAHKKYIQENPDNSKQLPQSFSTFQYYTQGLLADYIKLTGKNPVEHTLQEQAYYTKQLIQNSSEARLQKVNKLVNAGRLKQAQDILQKVWHGLNDTNNTKRRQNVDAILNNANYKIMFNVAPDNELQGKRSGFNYNIPANPELNQKGGNLPIDIIDKSIVFNREAVVKALIDDGFSKTGFRIHESLTPVEPGRYLNNSLTKKEWNKQISKELGFYERDIQDEDAHWNSGVKSN